MAAIKALGYGQPYVRDDPIPAAQHRLTGT